MFVSMLRWVCVKIDLLVKLAGYLSSILMPLLAGIVTFEVISRYFLNRPTIWAFDLSLFLFGYIALIGGAMAQQKRGHITVDILYKTVNKRTRRIFDLISFTMGIFFLALMVWICLDKVEEAIQFNTRRESEWAPSMLHFWIMCIVASTLFILQLARDIVDNVFVLTTGKPLVSTDSAEASYSKTEDGNGN